MPTKAEVEIIGQEDGMPVYRDMPAPAGTAEETPLWRKLLGESTFTGMSAAAVLGIGARMLGWIDPTGMSTLANMAVGLGTVIAGGAVGGFLQVDEFNKNAEEGKVVKPPSMMNEKAVHGVFSGLTLGAGLGGFALTLLGGGLGIGGGAALTLASPMIWPAALLLGAAGAIYFGVKGAKEGYKKQEQEYNNVATKYSVQKGVTVPSQARIMDAVEGVGHSAALGTAAVGTGIANNHEIIDEIATPTTQDFATAAGAVLAPNQGVEQQHESSQNMPSWEGYHPAQNQRGSFVQAEMQRRAAAPGTNLGHGAP